MMNLVSFLSDNCCEMIFLLWNDIEFITNGHLLGL